MLLGVVMLEPLPLLTFCAVMTSGLKGAEGTGGVLGVVLDDCRNASIAGPILACTLASTKHRDCRHFSIAFPTLLNHPPKRLPQVRHTELSPSSLSAPACRLLWDDGIAQSPAQRGVFDATLDPYWICTKLRSCVASCSLLQCTLYKPRH
jgi:hypothetical protein